MSTDKAKAFCYVMEAPLADSPSGLAGPFRTGGRDSSCIEATLAAEMDTHRRLFESQDVRLRLLFLSLSPLSLSHSTTLPTFTYHLFLTSSNLIIY